MHPGLLRGRRTWHLEGSLREEKAVGTGEACEPRISLT